MIIANQNYQYVKDRDDLALLHVLKHLPKALLGPVKEPSIPEHTDEDFNKFLKEERQEAHDLAKDLLSAVSVAIDIESPKTSIGLLRSQFGKEFLTMKVMWLLRMLIRNCHIKLRPQQ